MDDTVVAERAPIDVDDLDERLSSRSDGAPPDRLGLLSEEGLSGQQAQPPRPKRKSRRNGLLITACCAAVVAVGGGVYWISPYNHYSLADGHRLATRVRTIALNALPGSQVTPPLAPAAKLARAPAPTPAPVRERAPMRVAKASSGGDDMAAFLALGGHAPPPAPIHATADQTPIKTAVASEVPSEPAKPPVALPDSPPLPPIQAGDHPIAASAAKATGPTSPNTSAAAHDWTISTARPSSEPPHQADAKPATGQSAPAAEPIGASRLPASVAPAQLVVTPMPSDPAARIAALQAGPMTDAQQVQVLALVTQLGVLVRDQRDEIASLRTDQANLVKHVDSSLTDFDRRISLAEARGAVAAAMAVPNRSADAQTGAASTQSAVVPVAARRGVSPAKPETADGTHRYHVQAASPGLAMLSELDSSGGEEREIPVSPGDDVPGWGKVISIAQQGTTWVVKTGHGIIQ